MKGAQVGGTEIGAARPSRAGRGLKQCVSGRDVGDDLAARPSRAGRGLKLLSARCTAHARRPPGPHGLGED